MIEQRLPEFNQVTAGKTSQLPIPKYDLTLKAIELRMGGTTFRYSDISEIRFKLGTSPRWSISGTQLASILGYKTQALDGLHLPIDFSEREGKDIIAEEVGGWDLTKLSDQLFLEVDIASTASAPSMYAQAWFTPPQGADASKGQLVQKYVRWTQQLNATGNTRNQLNFDPKGAIIKRAFYFYGGTDWTPSADGNLNKIEVKKNGGTVFDQTCFDARYSQVRYRHNPQSKIFVVDFMIDNNLSGALRTADAKALEQNLFVTAADQVTAIYDVLDKPYNL